MTIGSQNKLIERDAETAPLMGDVRADACKVPNVSVSSQCLEGQHPPGKPSSNGPARRMAATRPEPANGRRFAPKAPAPRGRPVRFR